MKELRQSVRLLLVVNLYVAWHTKALVRVIIIATCYCIPPGSPHFGGLWEAGVKLVSDISNLLRAILRTFKEYRYATLRAMYSSKYIMALASAAASSGYIVNYFWD